MGRMDLLSILAVGSFLMAGGLENAVGQPKETKKKPAASAKKKDDASKATAKILERLTADAKLPEVPDVEFAASRDVAVDAEPVFQDPDETPEGRERIAKIEARVREIFLERDRVVEKRRPLAVDRDGKVDQMRNAQAAILDAQQTWLVLDAQAASLRSQMSVAKGAAAQQVATQLTNIQIQGANLVSLINERSEFINSLVPPIEALNAKIRPLDDQQRGLYTELIEARKQWLADHDPVQKYVRGDFEPLREALEQWLLIDPLWPSAYSWAALCAFELHEFEKAAEYLGKAQNVTDERSKTTAAQLHALTGLIYAKLPGQSEKAKKAIGLAERDTDTNKIKNWESNFLIGRYYLDREREWLKAKARFEKSLKVRPSAACTRLWLARLQTTASSEKVRDLPRGTLTLESLWDSTGKRSWQLAYFLFEAYYRAGNSAEADRIWTRAIELAPAERHEQLESDRRELWDKVKSPAGQK
jgi:tetratricopeptide (TPR) repeat protein